MFSLSRKPRASKSSARAAGPFRPGVESLESRLTPSTLVWTGAAAGDDLWSDAQNWTTVNTGRHVAPQAGDTVVFSTGTAGLKSYGSYNDMPGLAIRHLSVDGGGFDISGQMIAPTNGVTVNVALGSDELDLSIGGPGRLIKQGAGTLTLKGTNAYSGATEVQAGTLILASGGAVQASAVTVSDGATLELAPGVSASARMLTLSGSGVNNEGALYAATGNPNLGPNASLWDYWSGPITLAATATVDVGPYGVLTLNGPITGPGGLDVQAGNGVLTLAGHSNYKGLTEVQSGWLWVNGSIGNVQVDSGAQLDGIGSTKSVTVLAGGSIEAGNPGYGIGASVFQLGTLTINGNLTLGSGSNLYADVSSAAPGGYDQLKVSGQVNLNGARVDVFFTGSFTPPARGTTFTIINNGARAASGTFDDASGNPISALDYGVVTFGVSYSKGVVLTVQQTQTQTAGGEPQGRVPPPPSGDKSPA